MFCHDSKNMQKPEAIIYKIGGRKRPHNSFYIRLLFKMYAKPIIHRIVKNYLLKALRLPLSTSISQGFYVSAPLMEIGENVGLGDTFIVAYAPVKIGNNCSFSFHNTILTSSHDINDFSTVVAYPVIIGDNVWITTNVTILQGVTIGNNSVIGAGSVVTENIPSGVFAAGNPCRVIKPINFNK